MVSTLDQLRLLREMNALLAGGSPEGNRPVGTFAKAITPTLVAGRPHSLWYLGGNPGAGSAPAAGIGGEILENPVNGQLPFTDPVGLSAYLTQLNAYATQAGLLLLCDRLWQNSGIDETLNTEQVFTDAVQIPARDANGQNNGVGVEAALEVSTIMGAGTPTATLKYMNQSGTDDKTAANVDPIVAASAVGAFYRFGLAAGDSGIRKPKSLTLSATMTSGECHVILYRVIAAYSIDPASPRHTSMYLNKMHTKSVPFLVFIPNTTTASYISGMYQISHR